MNFFVVEMINLVSFYFTNFSLLTQLLKIFDGLHVHSLQIIHHLFNLFQIVHAQSAIEVQQQRHHRVVNSLQHYDQTIIFKLQEILIYSLLAISGMSTSETNIKMK